MKKRNMKKYIPYGSYCYGKMKSIDKKTGIVQTTGMCKNLIYIGSINDTMKMPVSPGSMVTEEIKCKTKVYRCRYEGVTTLDDFCLYDNCKICGVREPDDYQED